MTRIVKILSCILFFSFFACHEAHAQTTIKAASCSESDVNSALGRVSSGSVTVTIPSGTCGWASQLKYTVPSGVTSLTIQGNTTVNCTGTPGTAGYTCTATDNTVIQDTDNSYSPVISVSGINNFFRLTGITFEGTSSVTASKVMAVFTGSGNNLRIDHNHFDTTTYGSGGVNTAPTQMYGTLYGVVDHNLIVQGSQSEAVRATNGVGYGDASWAAPDDYGSANFIYVESNYLNGGMISDCNVGGRMVIRYDTLYSTSNVSVPVTFHQTGGGGGRNRGCRAVEVYKNYFYGPSSGMEAALNDLGLEWGNTLGGNYQHLAAGNVIRSDTTGHSNPSPPDGWGNCGSSSAWDANSTSSGYPCIDQPGFGQGDLISGAFPNAVDTATGKITWPHEYHDPTYLWMNTIIGGVKDFVDNVGPLVMNRDIYFDCGPANNACSGGFTGAAGTGYGTLAKRPTTCTAGPGGTYGQSPTGSYGVAYFATDANNGRGELYVCTSTNTWKAVYEPYVYPDPLVSGGAPDPPDSLAAAAH